MKVAELIAELGLEVDGASFALGHKMIEGVKTALGALAVFEGVNTLKEWVMHTSEAADKAIKLGQRLGTTSEVVQELGYAASLSDIEVGALVGSLTKLTRKLDQVGSKGKGPAADALKKLGITYKEIANLPIDQKLERIADGFADIKDESKRATLAIQLGLGPKLIPFLKDGGDGIREMREEARTLGLVVSTETAEAFEAWNDDMTRVQGAIQGLKNDAVVALIPLLKETTKSLFEWIKANRELVKQRLEQVMRGVLNVAIGLAKAFAKVYEIFEKVLPVVDDIAGALMNLLGFGETFGDKMEVIALGVAAVWALANLPLLLMIGLIGAAILIVDDLWSGLNGGDSVLGELLDAFEEKLGESGVGRVLLSIKDLIKDTFEYLEGKIKWLIEKGEWLGKTFHEIVHGDAQFQADQATAGGDPMAALRMRMRRAMGLGDKELRAMGVPENEIPGTDSVRTQKDVGPGVDRTITPSMRRGIDSTVRMAALPEAVIAPGGIPGLGGMQLPTLPSTSYTDMLGQISGAGIHVAAPTISVTVQGNADKNVALVIAGHVKEVLEGVMRDAAVATNARRGKVP